MNPTMNPSGPNATLLQSLTNGVKSQCGGETRMAVFADRAQSIAKKQHGQFSGQIWCAYAGLFFGVAEWISLALVLKALRTSDLRVSGLEGIFRVLRYDTDAKKFSRGSAYD